MCVCVWGGGDDIAASTQEQTYAGQRKARGASQGTREKNQVSAGDCGHEERGRGGGRGVSPRRREPSVRSSDKLQPFSSHRSSREEEGVRKIVAKSGLSSPGDTEVDMEPGSHARVGVQLDKRATPSMGESLCIGKMAMLQTYKLSFGSTSSKGTKITISCRFFPTSFLSLRVSTTFQHSVRGYTSCVKRLKDPCYGDYHPRRYEGKDHMISAGRGVRSNTSI